MTFPPCAHHICNMTASAVERSLLEVTINRGRNDNEIYGRGDRASEEGWEEKGMHG